MNYDFLGFIAGIFTTFSMAPQLWRVLRLRSARELSLVFILCMAFGNLLWLIYGILDGQAPIILWNSVSITLACGLIIAKLKYNA
ncbi:MAG: SemiSWEET transporter [Dehalococcoidia bacterium]|nr:SemiSWEET transporter [Dehalococcoidia bacterium]